MNSSSAPVLISNTNPAPAEISPVLPTATAAEKKQEPAAQPANNANTNKGSHYGVTLGGIKGLKSNAKEKLESAGRNRQVIAINDDNLAAAWKTIVDEMTTEKIIYRNAIGQGSIAFDGHHISVYVFGVAYDFLKNQRLKLLDYFKNHYQNDEINVVIIEKAPDASKMIEQVMSTKEVFEKMALQNPLLKKLKDNLGMDFEY